MRRPLVVALSLLLLSSTNVAAPSLAHPSSPADARIGQFEQILFGEVHSAKPLIERLNSLEVSVFGKTGKGGIQARLDAIGEVIDPNASPKLMPPGARRRDQSSELKHAVQAPERKQGHVDVSVQSEELDDLLRQGMDSYKRGRFDEAEHTFQRVIAEDSENPNALYNLGALSERRGELDPALRYYRLALSSNPKDQQLQATVDEVGNEVSRKQAVEARALAEREFALAAEEARRDKGVRRVRNVRYPSSAPVIGVTQAERPLVATTERQRGSGRSFARVFAGVALSVGVGSAAGGLHCPLCRMIGGF